MDDVRNNMDLSIEDLDVDLFELENPLMIGKKDFLSLFKSVVTLAEELSS